MYILAIDTATDSGGVALTRNGEVIVSIFLKRPQHYSDSLVDMIDQVLRLQELTIKDIDCFAVATGPGSFTGIRIGLSMVKALGQIGNVPAVGISVLEAMAYRFRCWAPRIAPMLDARRRQVFGGLFSVESAGHVAARTPESVQPPREWLSTLPGDPLLFVGDGVGVYQSLLEELHPQSRYHCSSNRVIHQVAELGFLAAAQGKSEPVEALVANYVRPSDAELGVKGGRLG